MQVCVCERERERERQVGPVYRQQLMHWATLTHTHTHPPARYRTCEDAVDMGREEARFGGEEEAEEELKEEEEEEEVSRRSALSKHAIKTRMEL